MQKMIKLTDLRMIVRFEDFDLKFETLKKQAESLHSQQIKDDNEYNAFELTTSQWYVNAYSLLRESFNSQTNKFEYEFRINYSKGTESLNQPNFQLHYKIKTKKDWLFTAREGLVTLRNILSVCDLVRGINVEETEKAKHYNFVQKVFFAVYLLDKLPSQFYPIPDLLMGNGVEFVDATEPNQIFNALVQHGYVTGTRGTFGQLTVDGKIKAAEITAASENNTESEKKNVTSSEKHGKIFISHSHKDQFIVGKFVDLILDNGLNIDTGSKVYCTSLDGSKPKTGIDFKNSIKEGLITAPVVLQFLSKSYKSSEVCLNEMGAAWVLSDNVFPLVVDSDQYDIGFIHSTNQQAQLHTKSDILKLTDELKDLGLWGENVKHSRLNTKIDEFISYVHNLRAKETQSVNSVSDINNTLKTDLKILTNYMDAKKYKIVRISKLANLDPKYNKEFIMKLMREFPDEITLTTIKGEDALHNLFPDFEFN